MGFKTDFSNVESKDFEALPGGQYPVYITGGEVKESGPNAKNPGAQYINWELTVTEEHEHAGRKFWMITSLLPQAIFGLKGLLEATGKWNAAELNDPDFEWDFEDVFGSKVVAKVTRSLYKASPEDDGEMQNKVKSVKSVDGAKSSSSTSGSLLP